MMVIFTPPPPPSDMSLAFLWFTCDQKLPERSKESHMSNKQGHVWGALVSQLRNCEIVRYTLLTPTPLLLVLPPSLPWVPTPLTPPTMSDNLPPPPPPNAGVTSSHQAQQRKLMRERCVRLYCTLSCLRMPCFAHSQNHVERICDS